MKDTYSERERPWEEEVTKAATATIRHGACERTFQMNIDNGAELAELLRQLKHAG